MKNNSPLKHCIKDVISKNKLLFSSIILVIISIVAVSLMPPQLLRIILDKKLTLGISDGLILLAVLYLLALTLNYALESAKEALLVIFGQKITKSIRNTMAIKAGRIETSYFTLNSSGDISSHFLSDVDKIGELFTSGVAGMAVDCFKIIGILASIFVFSSRLGWLAFALLPIIAVITRVFQKRMLKAQKQNRVYVGALSRHISESMKNIHSIKLENKETYISEKYSDCLEENFKAMEKVNFFDSIYSPIIIVLRAVAICAIALLTAGNFSFLGITIGMVAASIELVSSLFSPVEKLGMELASIQSAFSGISRVNEFCRQTEFEEHNQSVPAENLKSMPVLKFDNVHFSYKKGEEILCGISLEIQNGESVTFSGRTGAGKSTLFNLIMGLYAPTSGKILLYGIDVSRLKSSDKRRLVGYVCQKFDYVPGKISDQISLGDNSVTKEQIITAAKKVDMHDKIMALPKNYDTEITNTELFSEGEKQLLSIARAICCDPPLLLLDEITSGVDSVTETKILKVLQKVRKSHTILNISHRLTSILFCNKVLLLNKGTIQDITNQKTAQTKEDIENERNN